MRLGKFRKTPAERKRYTVDYTDWLDTSETVTAVNYTITPSGMVVDAQAILTGNKKISFYVSGGNNEETYNIDVKATTSSGQIKEDVVSFFVRDV